MLQELGHICFKELTMQIIERVFQQCTIECMALHSPESPFKHTSLLKVWFNKHLHEEKIFISPVG